MLILIGFHVDVQLAHRNITLNVRVAIALRRFSALPRDYPNFIPGRCAMCSSKKIILNVSVAFVLH